MKWCLVVLGCVAAVLGAVPDAAAAEGPALNGAYQAQSNGQWATTNDIYRDEAVVRSVWTIAMTCTDAITCRGTVHSDAGWSADIITTNGEYVIKRDLPNWEPCGDGRTVTGHQRYRFFPVSDDGYLMPGSRVFAGFDKTSGESGGCSRNEKLEIEMPFRLEKLE